MQILTLLLVVAVVAAFLGGRKAGLAVLASPFALFGWMAKGILGACGKGAAKWIGDLHRYGYRRRPGLTLLLEAWFIFAILLAIIVAGSR